MKKLIALCLISATCFAADKITIYDQSPDMIVGKLPVGEATTAQLATKLDASFTNELVGAYGSVYIHDGTNTVNLTTTNYTLVSMWMTNATQSRATPVNCDAMTNGIRVLVSGDYNVSYSLSMLGQNNSVVEAGLFVDGVHQDSSEFQRKISTGADVGSASAVSQIALTSNQVVNIGRISDVAGAFTIVQGQLVLSKIGASVTTADLSSGTQSAVFSNLTVTGSAILPSPVQIDEITGTALNTVKRYLLDYIGTSGGAVVSTSDPFGTSYYTPTIVTSGGSLFYCAQQYTTQIVYRVGCNTDEGTNKSYVLKLYRTFFYPNGSRGYGVNSSNDWVTVPVSTNVTTVTVPIDEAVYTNSAIQLRIFAATNSLGEFPTNKICISNPIGLLK